MATFDGTTGDDLLLDNSLSDDALNGFEGNDTLQASGGRDFVSAGPDVDLLALRWGLLTGPVFVDFDTNNIAFEDLGTGFDGATNAVTQFFVERWDIETGFGDDTIEVVPNSESSVNGGPGVDLWRARFEALTDAMDFQVFDAASDDGQLLPFGALLRNVERVHLSMTQGNDTFRDFGAFNDTVFGGLGDDTITSSGGRDELSGNGGRDRLVIDWRDTPQDVIVDVSGGIGAWLDNPEGFAGSARSVSAGFFEDLDVISGTGADSIEGTRGDDSLASGGGDDTLFGFGGDDTIEGGTGYDRVIMNVFQGAATVTKNEFGVFAIGTDAFQTTFTLDMRGVEELVFLDGSVLTADLSIIGTEGNDTLTSGATSDRVEALGGVDVLFGGIGFDTLVGGAGDDQIFGGLQGDSAEGGDGNDQIFLGNGFDQAQGGTGDDTINGGRGNDALFGNDGADVLNGGDGADAIFGGLRADTADGGNGADQLSLGNGFDLGSGGNGNDTVNGGRGNDVLFGNDGSDVLNGGIGNDQLFGGLRNDVVNGGDGADQIFAGNGFDVANGGRGADVLNGGNGNDTLSGGDGRDTLVGGAGDDSLSGGNLADVFLFDVTQQAGQGTDRIADFAASEDILRFIGVASEAISVTQSSGDTQITYGANTLILENVALTLSDIVIDA